MARKRHLVLTQFLGLGLIILVILGVVSFCLFTSKSNITKEVSPKYASTNLTNVVWNNYTQGIGKFSIQYPSTWTLEEKHEQSNREIDDPTEINTAILKGKEGEIVLQWGPMGFGGGCDHWEKIQLRDGTSDVCRVVDHSASKRYWNGISRPGPYDTNEVSFGARAEASSLDEYDAEVIEKILSTLKN